MANILATGIAHAPQLAAFDEMVKQRLEGIDLTPLLMYIIDTTDVDALPFLAEQFHVMGIEGWTLAVTEQDKRTLIKKAIELHRFKGTPWAVKNALSAVGFGDVTIVEGIGFDYNGQVDYDGSNTYSGGNWATFRIKIELPNDRPMTAAELANMLALIFEYKNVRSHLVDISFVVSLQDEVVGDDVLDFLVGDTVSDTLTSGINYAGSSSYNGTYFFNQANDPGTITIEIGGFSNTYPF